MGLCACFAPTLREKRQKPLYFGEKDRMYKTGSGIMDRRP
jgi:hypothetical protein